MAKNKPNEENPNPFKVARDAIEEAYGSQISELHYTIMNELEPGALDMLYRATDPNYAELDQSGQTTVREDAAFILGVAFGLRLKGGQL